MSEGRGRPGQAMQAHFAANTLAVWTAGQMAWVSPLLFLLFTLLRVTPVGQKCD